MKSLLMRVMPIAHYPQMTITRNLVKDVPKVSRKNHFTFWMPIHPDRLLYENYFRTLDSKRYTCIIHVTVQRDICNAKETLSYHGRRGL